MQACGEAGREAGREACATVTNLRSADIEACWSPGRTSELVSVGKSITRTVLLEPQEVGHRERDRADSAGLLTLLQFSPSLRPMPATLPLLAAFALALSAAPAHAEALTPAILGRAKSNCLSAVAKTVNRPRSTLKVITTHSDPSGAKVTIQVPKAQAPWSCLTNPKGDVEDVYFN